MCVAQHTGLFFIFLCDLMELYGNVSRKYEAFHLDRQRLCRKKVKRKKKDETHIRFSGQVETQLLPVSQPLFPFRSLKVDITREKEAPERKLR